jgi:hypothetical protein
MLEVVEEPLIIYQTEQVVQVAAAMVLQNLQLLLTALLALVVVAVAMQLAQLFQHIHQVQAGQVLLLSNIILKQWLQQLVKLDTTTY